MPVAIAYWGIHPLPEKPRAPVIRTTGPFGGFLTFANFWVFIHQQFRLEAHGPFTVWDARGNPISVSSKEEFNKYIPKGVKIRIHSAEGHVFIVQRI